jgi:hypothetical protein
LRIENGRRYFIPAPMWVVKAALGMGDFGMRIALRQMPEDQRIYVENIDFRELKKAMSLLKDYKGLNLVDVKTKDGTEVRIII